MTIITFNPYEIGLSRKTLSNFKKLFISTTSSLEMQINKDSHSSSRSMYAYNPITQSIVEIDPDQAWFWTPEWLNSELEVEKELFEGKWEEYDSLDEFIDSL